MGLFATVRHSLRILWRAARELFHEVTGAVFFILGLGALQAILRAWRSGAARWLIGMVAAYALLMIFFGVMSFRDSRRVR